MDARKLEDDRFHTLKPSEKIGTLPSKFHVATAAKTFLYTWSGSSLQLHALSCLVQLEGGNCSGEHGGDLEFVELDQRNLFKLQSSQKLAVGWMNTHK